MALELHSSKGFMTAIQKARSVPERRGTEERVCGEKIMMISLYRSRFIAPVTGPVTLTGRPKYGLVISNYGDDVDTAYICRGEVDPGKLFTSEDVTGKVDEKTDDLESGIREMFLVIDASSTCPLKPDCWKCADASRSSVFTLHRLGEKAWGLYRG